MTLIIPNMVDFIRNECSSLDEYAELARCLQEDAKERIRERSNNQFIAEMHEEADRMLKGLESGELTIDENGFIARTNRED